MRTVAMRMLAPCPAAFAARPSIPRHLSPGVGQRPINVFAPNSRTPAVPDGFLAPTIRLLGHSPTDFRLFPDAGQRPTVDKRRGAEYNKAGIYKNRPRRYRRRRMAQAVCADKKGE